MVSIKVGLCTRRKHHFNGINLLVVVVGYLRVIITAVNELHERETAVAMSKNILSCLAQIGNLEKQICSLSTDNGSDVLEVES